jgi:hypothetical protein
MSRIRRRAHLRRDFMDEPYIWPVANSTSARRDDYDFLFGTFLPFFRAFDSPMAIACLRLLTLPSFPPGPLLAVPRVYRCISLLTSLPALLEYLGLAVVDMILSSVVDHSGRGQSGLCNRPKSQPMPSAIMAVL